MAFGGNSVQPTTTQDEPRDSDEQPQPPVEFSIVQLPEEPQQPPPRIQYRGRSIDPLPPPPRGKSGTVTVASSQGSTPNLINFIESLGMSTNSVLRRQTAISVPSSPQVSPIRTQVRPTHLSFQPMVLPPPVALSKSTGPVPIRVRSVPASEHSATVTHRTTYSPPSSMPREPARNSTMHIDSLVMSVTHNTTMSVAPSVVAYESMQPDRQSFIYQWLSNLPFSPPQIARESSAPGGLPSPSSPSETEPSSLEQLARNTPTKEDPLHPSRPKPPCSRKRVTHNSAMDLEPPVESSTVRPRVKSVPSSRHQTTDNATVAQRNTSSPPSSMPRDIDQSGAVRNTPTIEIPLHPSRPQAPSSLQVTHETTGRRLNPPRSVRARPADSATNIPPIGNQDQPLRTTSTGISARPTVSEANTTLPAATNNLPIGTLPLHSANGLTPLRQNVSRNNQ